MRSGPDQLNSHECDWESLSPPSMCSLRGNPSQSIPRCPDLTERHSLLRKTNHRLPQLPQHPYLIPHLLIIYPHMIFHPDQPLLTPDIFTISLILHLLLYFFSWLKIAASLRQKNRPFDKKSPQGSTLK